MRNKAIGLAMAMKKGMPGGGICKACGGKIGMAHGGMVSEQEMENRDPLGVYGEDEEYESKSHMPGFSKSEEPYDEEEDYDEFPHGYSEGGGVDGQYDPHSMNDPDGDHDDLEYSPEVSASDFKDDNEEDDETSKGRENFLRAYMIHRRMKG